MKRVTVVSIIFMLLLSVGLLSAQVNVTFRVNTATVPDTVTASSVVQVRGGTSPLTWGGDTGGNLTNIGGDYWEVTLQFPANSSITYKLFANATGNPDGNGWESGNDLVLNVGESDTTLPIHYFRKLGSQDPFSPPFAATDSIDVWFRVNMQANTSFNPEIQSVAVRGAAWPGYLGDLTWNTDNPALVLEQEVGSDNAGQFDYPFTNFFSARVRIPADSVDEGQSIPYKFVIGPKDNPAPGGDNTTWETINDRTFTIPKGKADTTLYWAWWDDMPYKGATGTDTVAVKFTADLSTAINENGFTPGDTLLVQWGDNGTAVLGVDTLTREGLFGNIYSVEVEAHNVTLGDHLQYNYYIHKNGVNDREIYYDFANVTGTSADEKRKLTLPATAPSEALQAVDTVASIVDQNRQPRFRNLSKLPKEVTVYWEVDLRPPYYQILLEGVTLEDIQGDIHVGPDQLDSIFVWGVAMNGPAVGGWNNPGGADWGVDLRTNPDKQMWDDGTNGDMVAGDSVYTRTNHYGPDSTNGVIGQIFKFGIYGGDNEAGQGGYGNNHLENISLANPGDPTPETVTIHSQFGSINPGFYSRWNYDEGVVGIEEDGKYGIIRTVELQQNYPNPFNPVTTIKFQLPKAQEVSLEIYNALGQKVATLLDGKQREGAHVVTWNGLNSQGQPVGTGIYFYRLKTNNFDQTRKMILMK